MADNIENSTSKIDSTLIEIINLHKNKLLEIPIIKQQDRCFTIDAQDPVATCLAYLDKSHNRNIWKVYSDSSHIEKKAKQNKCYTTDFKTALHTLIDKLYGKPNIQEAKYEYSPHLLTLKKHSYDQINKKFKLEYDTRSFNNLHDILLYSPKSIDSHDKVLFIFYQLLKLVKYLHSIDSNCGELKLSDIYINENYWIRVKLPFESILSLRETTTSSLHNGKTNALLY